VLTVQQMLRDASSDVLGRYLEQRGLAVPPSFDWSGRQRDRARLLQAIIDAADDDLRGKIFDDAQRVLEMASEGGINALISIGAMTDELLDLENDVTRMLLLLLDHPATFEAAEHVRYADDKRLGRTWSGYVGPKQLAVERSDASITAFEGAVRDAFETPLAEIDVCERSRPRANQPAQLIQATVFSEGRPNTRRAFVEGQLDRVPDRPVIESVVTYEPDSGVIEVIASNRDDRLKLAKLFAEHLLQSPIDGTRVKLREYRLNPLRRRVAFDHDPADKILGVRVWRMCLMPRDTHGERIIVETHAQHARSIWDMITDRFGEKDPLVSGYDIIEACLRIRFDRQGRRRARTLNVRIRMPDGCNLKERSEQERLIGQRYLERWGLLAEV
jgi:hypothetical protein